MPNDQATLLTIQELRGLLRVGGMIPSPAQEYRITSFSLSPHQAMQVVLLRRGSGQMVFEKPNRALIRGTYCQLRIFR